MPKITIEEFVEICKQEEIYSEMIQADEKVKDFIAEENWNELIVVFFHQIDIRNERLQSNENIEKLIREENWLDLDKALKIRRPIPDRVIELVLSKGVTDKNVLLTITQNVNLSENQIRMISQLSSRAAILENLAMRDNLPNDVLQRLIKNRTYAVRHALATRKDLPIDFVETYFPGEHFISGDSLSIYRLLNNYEFPEAELKELVRISLANEKIGDVFLFEVSECAKLSTTLREEANQLLDEVWNFD